MSCIRLVLQDYDSNPEQFHLWMTNQEDLCYLLLCLTVILDKDDEDNGNVSAASEHLVQRLQDVFPEDIYLLEDLGITFTNAPGDPDSAIEQMINRCIEYEGRPPTPKRRTSEERQGIYFKVGTYFQHRRYNYTAFIVGWDTSCQQPARWQEYHDVHRLQHGSQQCFYHAV